MSYKLLDAVEWKAGKEGGFRARFATLGVVDLDGDVTMAGAFPVGKQVPVSAFGHASHRGALPVGTAVITVDGQAARAIGRFFVETIPGRDHWLTLRELGGLSQWSYAYDVLDASTRAAELARYGPLARRILKRLDVFEVSPVLRGAGINTGTESIKCTGCGRPLSQHVGIGEGRRSGSSRRLADPDLAALELELMWSAYETERILKETRR